MKAKFDWLFSLACTAYLFAMASGQDNIPQFRNGMGEIANGVQISVDPENNLETGKLIAEIEELPSLHALNFTNLDLAKGSILDNDLKKARYVANPKNVLRQLLLDGKYPEVTKGKIVAGDAVELDVLDDMSIKVEYEKLKDMICVGGLLESFKNLQDAKEACDPSSACGCISDKNGTLFTTNYGIDHFPAIGGIAYIRLTRTKGAPKPKPEPKPVEKCQTDSDCPPGEACIKPWPGAPFKLCVPRKKCQTDADCAPGEVCKKPCPYCPYKVCMPAPKPKPKPGPKPKPCKTDADCPPGYFCKKPHPFFPGKCVPKPKPKPCNSDADCPPGYFCKKPLPFFPGKCVPKPKPKPCNSDADCPPGYFCKKPHPFFPGKCIPMTLRPTTVPSEPAQDIECRDSFECADGLVCRNDKCEEEKCKKIGQTCARDLDPKIDCCEDGSFCNVLPHGWGTCTYVDQLDGIKCSSTKDCTPGKVCIRGECSVIVAS